MDYRRGFAVPVISCQGGVLLAVFPWTFFLRMLWWPVSMLQQTQFWVHGPADLGAAEEDGGGPADGQDPSIISTAFSRV